MRKKSLVMLLSAVLVITSVAFGTIAYLTDRESITNTFTVGNVDLKLDETAVDENGNPIPDENDPTVNQRTEEDNSYHLVPGKKYTKDPMVTVLAKSEPSYIRLLVTVSKASELQTLCQDLHAKYPEEYLYGLPQDHVTGYDANVWRYVTAVEDTAANTVTYEFRYYDVTNSTDIVAAGDEDRPLEPLFQEIVVPAYLDYTQLNTIAGFQISVVAQAIQAEGFNGDAEAAWSAFAVQTTPAQPDPVQPNP